MDPQIAAAIDEGRRTYENKVKRDLDEARAYLRKDCYLIKRITEASAKNRCSFEISEHELQLKVQIDSLITAINEYDGVNASRIKGHAHDYINVSWSTLNNRT